MQDDLFTFHLVFYGWIIAYYTNLIIIIKIYVLPEDLYKIEVFCKDIFCLFSVFIEHYFCSVFTKKTYFLNEEKKLVVHFLMQKRRVNFFSRNYILTFTSSINGYDRYFVKNFLIWYETRNWFLYNRYNEWRKHCTN